MDKSTAQERVAGAETAEPRKLNMEEKRKLEKLLIADIDSAMARHDATAKAEREALVEKLNRTPSVEAKRLYETYRKMGKERAEIEARLGTLGYGVSYNGDLGARTVGTLAKELAEFNERANLKRDSLASLKRTYVIKLFADHADTQSLFGALAKDLERLVG